MQKSNSTDHTHLPTYDVLPVALLKRWAAVLSCNVHQTNSSHDPGHSSYGWNWYNYNLKLDMVVVAQCFRRNYWEFWVPLLILGTVEWDGCGMFWWARWMVADQDTLSRTWRLFLRVKRRILTAWWEIGSCLSWKEVNLFMCVLWVWCVVEVNLGKISKTCITLFFTVVHSVMILR